MSVQRSHLQAKYENTLRQCTHCGIPYCLQIVLTSKLMYVYVNCVTLAFTMTERAHQLHNDNAPAHYTGCGKKKSLIWEANKFKSKEDTANVFFISGKYTECRFTSTCFEQNITQVAALNIDKLM